MLISFPVNSRRISSNREQEGALEVMAKPQPRQLCFFQHPTLSTSTKSQPATVPQGRVERPSWIEHPGCTAQEWLALGTSKELTSIRGSPFHCQTCPVLGECFLKDWTRPASNSGRQKNFLTDGGSSIKHGTTSLLLGGDISLPYSICTVADDTTHIGCHSKGLCLPDLFSDLSLSSRLAYPTIFLTSSLQYLIAISSFTHSKLSS